MVILFGMAYIFVGIAFPNPGQEQLLWRLAAWITSVFIFGFHIWYEYFRLRNLPRIIAFHVAAATALGALGLAIAANIHSLHSVTANHPLLVLSLILWPILIGVPAFVAAIIISVLLTRIKRIDKS